MPKFYTKANGEKIPLEKAGILSSIGWPGDDEEAEAEYTREEAEYRRQNPGPDPSGSSGGDGDPNSAFGQHLEQSRILCGEQR